LKIRLSASISTPLSKEESYPAELAPALDTSLDSDLLAGIAWTGGMKWAVQIVSWASTMIVARLLTPGDFGLMGMAAVYLGFVALVNEFGLTAAILRDRDLSEGHIAQLGGFGIVVGMVLCLLSVAVAGPIAGFYGESEIRGVVEILSLNFLFSSIGVLPRALLARDLRFRQLSFIDAASNAVQIAFTITLAFLGFRYLSLVFGSLAASAVASVLACLVRRHRLAFPTHVREISESLRVGWHVVVGRISWYTYQNADFAIVGRVLGKGVLGAYTLGWEIATLPVERISALISQVTPAIFSSVSSDRPALRRYYLALVEGLAFFTFPASVGIALTAPLLVPLALGPQWTRAILPLQLLAVYGGMRSITTINAPVMIYTRHSRQSMWYAVIGAVVLPAMFFFGTRWGAAGVAAMWIIGYPVVLIPSYRLVFRILELSPRAFFLNLWPAISSTLLMALAVFTERALVAPSMSVPVRLGMEVALGVIVYSGVMLALHRQRLLAFVTLVRTARRTKALAGT